MAENDINENMFSRLDQFDLYNRLQSRQGPQGPQESTELVLERCIFQRNLSTMFIWNTDKKHDKILTVKSLLI